MDQENIVIGSFIWTFDDVKSRQEALAPIGARQRRFLFFFLILMAVGIMIVGRDIKEIFRSFNDAFLTLVPLIIILTIYPITRYSHNANLKKGFMQSPDRNKLIKVTVTREEIVLNADGIYENRWKWNTIKDVRLNPEGFCFFIAEQAGFWIPIRAFSTQTDINAIMGLSKELSPKFSMSS